MRNNTKIDSGSELRHDVLGYIARGYLSIFRLKSRKQSRNQGTARDNKSTTHTCGVPYKLSAVFMKPIAFRSGYIHSLFVVGLRIRRCDDENHEDLRECPARKSK